MVLRMTRRNEIECDYMRVGWKDEECLCESVCHCNVISGVHIIWGRTRV